MDLVATDAPNVLVVTGMSGAGRSSAAKVLEDLGFTVIDNLPPELLNLAVQSHDIPNEFKRLAVVMDSRGGLSLRDVDAAVTELEREGVQCRFIFLDADDDVIVTRYAENRRPHPLGGDTVIESIHAERELLSELRAMSDVVIDTSRLNVHELRDRITAEFSSDDTARPMRVSVRSFGFKHGAPRDVDLMFDVRFLPNPHWVSDLRDKTGLDDAVSEYVLNSDGATEFVESVDSMLKFLIPRYQSEGKSYLSIGIGCTGGHHRSVALAEELAKRIDSHDVNTAVRHRDIEK